MEKLRANKRIIFRSIFFSSVVISVFVAMTAVWLHRVFFNQEKLSDITTSVLEEQSSRDSIGYYVANKVFEDKPVLLQTAGPRLASVVSSILGTDIASNTVDRLVEQTSLVLTSNSQEDIAINLTPIKSTITKVQSVIGANEEERKIDETNIPDEILIIDKDSIPNFYVLGIILLWLGPICLIYALIGMGYWVYKGRKIALYRRLIITGMIFLCSVFIALLIGPLTKPVFLSIAREAPAQTLLNNLYEGLINPFINQAYILLALSVVLILFGFLYPKYKNQKK